MKLNFLFLFLFLNFAVHAQQDAQYTYYMYNTANINPGYSGSRGVLSIVAMHRNQWVGFDGAPKTNTLALHSPIGTNNSLGIGATFINDRLGPSDENTVSFDLSYNVNTSNKFKLAFGVKGTLDFLNVDYSKLDSYDAGDPLNYKANIDNSFFPNIGAGVYWYSQKTYIGLSVPYFLEKKYYDNSTQYTASEKMHFHLIGGYVFDVNSSLKFKPAFLSKIVKGAPLQLDLSGGFLFFDKLSLGAAYRWNAAVSAMAGFQISDSWLVGYAYDRDATRLNYYNSGSHEIFLRYELFRNYDKIISPRFF